MMAHPQLLSALIVLLSAACVPAEFVILGDSVTLTATRDCTEEFKLMTNDNSQTVARRVNGVWEPEEAYKHQIEHVSPTSVNLTRVNANNAGWFEFICGGGGGAAVTAIQLAVFFAFDTPVSEGETVQLPCHSSTKDPVKLLRWEKDGELVLELDPSSWNIAYGTRFDGRVSVSREGYQRGDLSLTLEGVQPRDHGDFICYLVDKDGNQARGNPAAVRMRIRDPDQVTCPPPTPSTTPRAPEEKKGPGFIVMLTAIVLLLSVVAILAILLWKSRRPHVSSGPRGGGRPSTDVTDEGMALTERGPPGSLVNGNSNGY